jgi:hypothetical protein
MRDFEECQPYVDHLTAEHRRLHTMLRQARGAIVQCGGPDRDATGNDVVRVLRRVRDELACHFAQEESGGCMNEAVSRCPRLSLEVQRIEAEHSELLAELDRVLAQALDLDDSVQSRIAFENAFDNLCRQIHAHEAAENVILSQGFGTNINGEESDKPATILDD